MVKLYPCLTNGKWMDVAVALVGVGRCVTFFAIWVTWSLLLSCTRGGVRGTPPDYKYYKY
jgi:hypothetical protein